MTDSASTYLGRESSEQPKALYAVQRPEHSTQRGPARRTQLHEARLCICSCKVSTFLLQCNEQNVRGWAAGLAGLWIVQQQDGLCTLRAHAAARTLPLDFSCTRYPIHPLCELGGAHERLGVISP